MRNPESLFNHLVTFINSVEEGEIFQVSDLINKVGPHETPSRWKNWNNNPYYTTRSYLSHVKNVEKFITRVSYGKYKVIKHFPVWFDLGHLFFLRGYGGYDWVQDGTHRRSFHNNYKGMTVEDILNKLEGKTQIQIEVQVKRPLPRLYKTNRHVYNLFIKHVNANGPLYFRSQNALYCFIEDLKNPRLSTYRRTNTPYYSGDKNYGPIIAHLIADGIIERGSNINNRYTFKVLGKTLKERYNVIYFTTEETKTSETENYIEDVNKTNISILAGEESKFNPSTAIPGNSQSTTDYIEVLKLAAAEIHLTNAIRAFQACSITDQHMNARLYNIQALTQDVRAAIIDKKEFLINR
jgi:hypothetical protein